MTEPEGGRTGSSVKLESLIATVLRYGVLLSTAIIALGVFLSPFKFGAYPGCPSSLEGVCATNFGRPVSSLGDVAAGLLSLNPLAIIEAGVLVLLVIPFFRVGAGGVMYALERKWTYVAISVLVFAVLLFSAFVVAPWEAWG